jgi:predicted metal-binding protein
LKLKLFLPFQVLEQILCCGLTKDETHGLAEADQSELPEKEIDIENQCDKPQDNAGNKSEVMAEVAVEMDMEVDELDNDEDEEFHAPLLSLFVTVCDTFISDDQDLSSVFGTVDAMSLPKKLKKMVEDNSILTVHCMWLVKLTCKMVISMMKHRGSYLKEDMESLTEALSSASESMSLLDVSMVFASEDDGAATAMKPLRSLGSLVKEAKGSVDTYFKVQQSEIVEPFTSTDELI